MPTGIVITTGLAMVFAGSLWSVDDYANPYAERTDGQRGAGIISVGTDLATSFAGDPTWAALKGVGAVIFLYIAKLIAPQVMRFVPEGRVRRLLLMRLNKSGN